MSDAIGELLATDPGDPATMSDDAFLAWLEGLVCDTVRDEAFRLRLEIRSIWLANPGLLAASAELDAAEEAKRASPEHDALQRTARALHGAEQAVEGLTLAVIEGRTDDESKLVRFEQQVEVLRAELDALRSRSEVHHEAQRAREALESWLSHTGLRDKRAALRAVEHARGRSSTSAGRRFEDRGASTIELTLFPRLRAAGHDPRLLRGVTLGCARGEWDGLVVEAAITDPVVVLGMVEFKRNPNDLGHGFTLRQENLAWLRGDESGYDPSLYRTQRYPEGRFEGPVVETGLTFTRDSFAGLLPDPKTGDVLEGLHFVTTERPLTGLSSRELHRMTNRIAGDLSVDWTDRAALARDVRSWLDPDALRTADVLQRYVDAGLRDNVRFTLDDSG